MIKKRFVKESVLFRSKTTSFFEKNIVAGKTSKILQSDIRTKLPHVNFINRTYANNRKYPKPIAESGTNFPCFKTNFPFSSTS